MALSFVHRKPVDMEKLTIQHAKQVALGNMGVNARGDVLGAGGKVIKTREEVMKEYYEANANLNPKAVVNIKYEKDENALRNAVMNPQEAPVKPEPKPQPTVKMVLPVKEEVVEEPVEAPKAKKKKVEE